MEIIKKLFDEIAPATEEEWKFFESGCHRKGVPKGSLILPQGAVENQLSFVETGLLRHFIPNEEVGITCAFVFAGSFSSAYESFLLRQPSAYAIEALLPTTLIQISHTRLQEVYAKTEVGEKIGRYFAERVFAGKAARELSFLQQTAEERYRYLLNERSDIVQEIPLKYIASYLGITPQGLSRIRKRIS